MGDKRWNTLHYSDVIMGAIASQIISLVIVYSTVYTDADPRKHQSSASLASVWGIHWGSVNFPHKWPVTRKMFPFDDVIMIIWYSICHKTCITVCLCSYIINFKWSLWLFNHIFRVDTFAFGQPCDYDWVSASRLSNFIPHLIMDMIAYPCWDLSSSMLVKGALSVNIRPSSAMQTREPIL